MPLNLAHPNPSPLVNEHEAIVGSVRLEDSLSACEGLAIVFPPLTQEVGCAIELGVALCAF